MNKEIFELLSILREYLKLKSCDGKSERQILRKKLSELLDKIEDNSQ